MPDQPPDPSGPADPHPDGPPADTGDDGHPRGTGSTGDAPSGDPADRLDAAFDGPAWSSPRRRHAPTPTDQDAPTDQDGAPEPEAPMAARRRSRRSTPARTAVRVGLWALGGLAVLTVAWVVVTAVIARSQLEDARGELSALRTQLAAGQVDQARATAQSLVAHARHAHQLTTGPAWAATAAVPLVGDPVKTVRGVTGQVAVLADDAVPGLITVADEINPRTVVSHGATVDLRALQAAAPSVHRATVAVNTAAGRLATLPASTWLPFVDTARASVAGQLKGFGSTLGTADRALQVLPTMLGADGRPRHYFIAFQNNAELRGTGGLPGAFAIASVTDGAIHLDRFESDSILQGVGSGLDFGPEYDAHYAGDQPYTQYVDSNVSPNFPYAAQIWCAMWRNVTGQVLDGALTVDPGALSYLLAATGPATAPDGLQVTSANVVALLQKDVYAKFPQREENNDRKNYILGIASAVEKKIVGGTHSPRKLLEGLARGVSERRIVAWSNESAVESALAGAPVGGVVTRTTEPYSLLSVNNGSAGKLDYYLHRKVAWVRSGCGSQRDVTVTVSVTNDAPASGLPPYVTVRADDPRFPTVPGQNRPILDYIATTGAQLLGVTVDGQSSGAGVFDEEGHPAYRVIVELPPGATSTVVYRLREPVGDRPVTVVNQPGVTPVEVSVDDRSCR